MRTNGSHLSGSASSGKIASTGHSGSHAPQSMHSSGSMTRIRSAWWMQSTGQTSTHERSLMSVQGSAIMYVVVPYPTGATSSSMSSPARSDNVDFLTRYLGMHVIERTDTFTLVGADARRSKLTLFDAEEPRRQGALRHIAF